MYRVAVIGECMVELYQENDGGYTQTFGGDTFNCAIYLKRSLGNVQVEYITVLGEEALSTKMLDFFHTEEIETTYIDRLNNKSVGLYMIDTEDGERSFSYWRSDSAAKRLFLTQSLEKIKSDLMGFDLIYFSAITLAIMSQEGRNILYNFLENTRKNGVKIAYDSNYRPQLYSSKKHAKSLHTEALQYCDIFLPSLDDERALWGDIGVDEIIKNTGCSEVVLKRGEEEVVYSLHGRQGEVRVKKLEKIIDTTSAGDAFNGTYLAARLEGSTMEEAIKKASKLASKVIMHQGAIIPKEESD